MTRLPSRPNSPHLLATMTSSGRAAEQGTDQLLVGTESIQRRRVEMRHAEIQRAADHAFGDFTRLRRSIGVRQVHAPEADGGDFAGTELASL